MIGRPWCFLGACFWCGYLVRFMKGPSAMSYVETVFEIEGIAPLLMHNGQLANPLNPLVKEMKKITGIRKKTDEHHLELQRLEFRASLYLNSAGNVIVPSEVIESCLIEGAKKAKLGKAFKSSITVLNDPELSYGKRLTVEQLWDQCEEFADVRGVKVGTSRVMRTRPIFRNWSLTFEVAFDSEQIDAEQLEQAVHDASRMGGLCD